MSLLSHFCTMASEPWCDTQGNRRLLCYRVRKILAQYPEIAKELMSYDWPAGFEDYVSSNLEARTIREMLLKWGITDKGDLVTHAGGLLENDYDEQVPDDATTLRKSRKVLFRVCGSIRALLAKFTD